MPQLRHSCPLCDDLRAELAYYKQELGMGVALAEAHDLRRGLKLSSPGEARLLLRLFKARGHTLLKDQLADDLRDDTLLRTIDVYVCRIRKILGEGILESIQGGAIRLTPAGVALVQMHQAPTKQDDQDRPHDGDAGDHGAGRGLQRQAA